MSERFTMTWGAETVLTLWEGNFQPEVSAVSQAAIPTCTGSEVYLLEALSCPSAHSSSTPISEKCETQQFTHPAMVSDYLFCEGISSLEFLCVYIDNENIYSYTKQETSGKGASCMNSSALPMHCHPLKLCKVPHKRAGYDGSYSSNYWCLWGVKFLNFLAVGQRLKTLDFSVLPCSKFWKKDWIFHRVGFWLPPQYSWTFMGFV